MTTQNTNPFSSLSLVTPAASGSQSNAAKLNNSNAAVGSDDPNNPAQTFLNYMKESVAQRYEDQWLGAHHLTSADLAKMSPAERAKIQKEMEADIQKSIQQDTQAKLAKANAISL